MHAFEPRIFRIKVVLVSLSLALLLPTSRILAQPVVDWDRSFGGYANELGYSGQETSDGGYIILARTDNKLTADDPPQNDAWLIKTDADGTLEWSVLHGGDGRDVGYEIRQMADGGYVFVGITRPVGGSENTWLVKTDSSGEAVWSRAYDDSGLPEVGQSFQQTEDLGYIVASRVNHPRGYVGLMKLDPNGDVEWQRTFKPPPVSWHCCPTQVPASVQQTADGGYVVAGRRSGAVEGDTSDVLLMKTDPSGLLEWEKVYNGMGDDETSMLGSRIVLQTEDGGYILAAWTMALSGSRNRDAWLIKTDAAGNRIWDRTYGGPAHDYPSSIQPTRDGAYVMSGTLGVPGEGADVWLLKIGSGGSPIWEINIDGGPGDHGFFAQQTRDGGYVVIGANLPPAADGNADVWLIKVEADNLPPAVDAGGPYSVHEGSATPLTAAGSDPNGDPLDYAWDLDEDALFETAGQEVTFSAEFLDGPGLLSVSVQATDPLGLTATDSARIDILNVAPVVGEISVPAGPVAVGTSITFSAAFSDAGVQDTHTARWEWGDLSSSDGTVDQENRSVTDTHTYEAAGIYTVKLSVEDDDGGGGSAPPLRDLIIYDPEGAFVSGSGWIKSPAGAYKADAALAGRATFAFVTRYLPGAERPTTQTHFKLGVADFEFDSSTCHWLVVTAGEARYSGTGTINGSGEYGYCVTAVDAALSPSRKEDALHLKIWIGDDTSQVIYDNDVGDPLLAIGGGQIAIHD